MSSAYAQDSGRSQFVLDFDYKQVGPGGGLVVKQVRRVPEPSTSATVTPFLVNGPLEYRTFRGEAGTAFSNHRLKSRLTFETRSMWLTPENLSGGLFSRIELESTDGCSSFSLGGPATELPGATYSFAGGTARHGFSAV